MMLIIVIINNVIAKTDTNFLVIKARGSGFGNYSSRGWGIRD